MFGQSSAGTRAAEATNVCMRPSRKKKAAGLLLRAENSSGKEKKISWKRKRPAIGRGVKPRVSQPVALTASEEDQNTRKKEEEKKSEAWV